MDAPRHGRTVNEATRDGILVKRRRRDLVASRGCATFSITFHVDGSCESWLPHHGILQ